MYLEKQIYRENRMTGSQREKYKGEIQDLCSILSTIKKKKEMCKIAVYDYIVGLLGSGGNRGQ